MGQGSLGADKDAADELNYNEREVKVRRVPLQKYSAASTEAIRPLNGSFAYWVGDEGVKAKINIPDGTDEKFVKNRDWDQLFNVAAQRNGVSLVEGLSNFDSWWDKDAENASVPAGTRLRYVGNASSLPVYVEALGGGSVSTLKESAQKLFHDVSFVSQGILTDTYNGGLKTDLSLAFEMPWEKEGQWTKGFRDIKKFHGSGEKNKFTSVPASTDRTKWWIEQPSDGLGYLYEIAAGDISKNGRTHKYLRGPTWDLVRNYYRLYKREDEKAGYLGLKPSRDGVWIAVGGYPYSNATKFSDVQGAIQNTIAKDLYGTKANYSLLAGSSLSKFTPALLTDYSGESVNINGVSTNLIIPQSMPLTPVVQKIALCYGVRLATIKGTKQLQLVIAPMVMLHNPYNVPIEFTGFSMTWNSMHPFALNLHRVNLDATSGMAWNKSVADTAGPDLQYDPVFAYRDSSDSSIDYYSNKLSFRVYSGLHSPKGSISGTFILAPGEIRMFYPYLTELNDAGGDAARLRDYAMLYYTEKATSLSIQPNIQAITLIPRQKTGARDNLLGIEIKKREFVSYNTGVDLSNLAEPDVVYATVEIYPSTVDSTHVDQFAFDMFYPNLTNGSQASNQAEFISNFVRGVSRQSGFFSHDEPHLLASVISARTHFSGDDNARIEKSFRLALDGKIEYLFSDIIYRQPAEESGFVSPLRTNPRAYSVSPYEYDGKFDGNEKAVGVGWIRRATDFSDSNWPEDLVNSTWGDSIDGSGQRNIVLYEIPTAPLVSLGQLQHVNCSVLNSEPGYVIGNSYQPIGFSSQTDVLVWPSSSGNAAQPRGDTPFAANLELFDSYFFSGINVGDADSAQTKDIDTFVTKVFSTDETENPFPNKRISLIRDFGDRKEADVKKDFYDPEKVARDLMFDGTFNVNSTSKEAWKAVLSGLQGKILKIDGTWREVSSTPLARFVSIIGSRLGGFSNLTGSGTDGDGDSGSGWRWYCELSAAELDKLAEAIVEQVRSRGPFMSLGDFVNRRLTTGTNGKAGTLQAAIDASGINTARKNELNDTWKAPDSSRFPGLSGLSAGAQLNKAGVPGYVSQGDILSATAPSLSARSDTFTIRAYGDVFGVSGTPQARAWCEAVVQRTPEFFDPQYDDETEDEVLDVVKFRENYRSNQDDEVSGRDNRYYVLEKRERNDKLSSVNKLFGRRYKIVSFRWLSQDEL